MARVLISMPEEFLTRIDEVAEGENRTRSELIREALRTYIHKQRVKENAIAMKNKSATGLKFWEKGKIKRSLLKASFLLAKFSFLKQYNSFHMISMRKHVNGLNKNRLKTVLNKYFHITGKRCNVTAYINYKL